MSFDKMIEEYKTCLRNLEVTEETKRINSSCICKLDSRRQKYLEDWLAHDIEIVIINLNLLIFPVKLNITDMVKF